MAKKELFLDLIRHLPETFYLKRIKNRVTAYAFCQDRPETSKYPITMNVEITNNCNFRCLMCPIDDMTRPVGYMKFETWKKIIDEIKGHTEAIAPFLFGEPLLHPQIIDFIKYAKENQIMVFIDTNGSMLNESMARGLFQAKTDKITICLDATTKEVYEQIRRGGKYEETIKNINAALRIKKEIKAKTIIDLQFIVLRNNEHQIEEFVKKWKKKVNRLNIKKFGNLGGQLKQEQYAWEIKQFQELSLNPCDLLWRSMAIAWNGDVLLCCKDIHGKTIGNVTNQSIAEIWNSKKMQTIRKEHLKGNRKDLCGNCSHKTHKGLWITAVLDTATIERIK
ncbi:MAG TPA: radical SAM protein [archaeon]|nr:radical SAM protein [archaeon]